MFIEPLTGTDILLPSHFLPTVLCLIDPRIYAYSKGIYVLPFFVECFAEQDTKWNDNFGLATFKLSPFFWKQTLRLTINDKNLDLYSSIRQN